MNSYNVDKKQYWWTMGFMEQRVILFAPTNPWYINIWLNDLSKSRNDQ